MYDQFYPMLLIGIEIWNQHVRSFFVNANAAINFCFLTKDFVSFCYRFVAFCYKVTIRREQKRAQRIFSRNQKMFNYFKLKIIIYFKKSLPLLIN